jgi:viologen exporter family transport system permease protein
VRSTLQRAEARSLANAALAAFRLGVRQTFAAWPVLLGRTIFYLVIMAVLSSFWDKVTDARLAGTLAATLPKGALTLYVGVTEWITLSVAAIHLRLEDDIRSGALEPHLLRPKPYLLQKIAESMGGMVARLSALGLAATLALLLSGRASPPALAFVYIVILGVLGSAIGVLLFAIAGLCAFWIRRVLPPYLIVQKLTFVLGGLFAPISLYPAWLFQIAVVTPFAAHTYFPGTEAIAPSAPLFVRGLAAQLFWLAALAGLVALIWNAGIRRVLREGI